jgi:hypothetical protein
LVSYLPQFFGKDESILDSIELFLYKLF